MKEKKRKRVLGVWMVASRYRCTEDDCAGRLYYEQDVLLASNPMQREVYCDVCGAKGFRHADHV